MQGKMKKKERKTGRELFHFLEKNGEQERGRELGHKTQGSKQRKQGSTRRSLDNNKQGHKSIKEREVNKSTM